MTAPQDAIGRTKGLVVVVLANCSLRATNAVRAVAVIVVSIGANVRPLKTAVTFARERATRP
jgi:hypothetical protein